MKKGMLLIRLMLGLTFLIHGSQKVFSGFEAPIQMMQGLGLPAFLGVVLGLFEFVGGILMILGILSNYIALGFIITMLGALFTVHLAQGYMSSELVIILLVMSIAVTISYKWKKFIEFS
ncbi:DoxX family protein [Staphylococcus succinus]|uniref:DoxX family protein n=1 Tax=Staphylococcus succinus TaxID=61015 RepID=UPI000E6A8A25|nr:DoxX family protein [Staphylococcus succinus]RIN35630.1 DoxX family protein [Staphylococcus succinus]